MIIPAGLPHGLRSQGFQPCRNQARMAWLRRRRAEVAETVIGSITQADPNSIER